uniref:Uncharacterized protein n=1 Tax=Nelumbo nucifera TaxID=4432 RepID=A0A822ZQM4_NELNU|nr:TPA_asm: hypothetical protein HUJ06_003879 [Nelumbo nucifera]
MAQLRLSMPKTLFLTPKLKPINQMRTVMCATSDSPDISKGDPPQTNCALKVTDRGMKERSVAYSGSVEKKEMKKKKNNSGKVDTGDKEQESDSS